MINSMTGFGRSEIVSKECKIAVEMKAVNHRYCDLNIKLPKKLNSLETAVRSYLKTSIHRGKVDVFVTYEDLSEESAAVRLNAAMGREYYEALEKISDMFQIPNDATASKIARFPEVLVLEDVETDHTDVSLQLMEALREALAQFQSSRQKEGEHLRLDMEQKLSGMLEGIGVIEKQYPQMVSDYRKKLEKKVQELLTDANIDENRIATEVVIYADKICVDEETVRLRSHIVNMTDELQKGGSVGRKLDFIAQEMNREANTILSKANDLTVSNQAIALKTEIERIREQIQNLE